MDHYTGEIVLTIETRNFEDARQQQLQRCLQYYIRMIEISRNLKKKTLKQLLEKESYLEKRIYRKMKEWEGRHPIMGIVIFTILMGILISLLAGIILEAIY